MLQWNMIMSDKPGKGEKAIGLYGEKTKVLLKLW